MENKLVLNQFDTQFVTIYNPDGSVLFENVSEHSLNDLQCQICQLNLSGYTYSWKGKYGTISNNGELSDWFEGMFDLTQVLFCRLFKLRKLKKDNENSGVK